MPTLVSHVWKPSQSRRIKLDGFVPVPRGSSSFTITPLSWPAKDPGDVLDYMIDVEPAVIGNEGDCILSADVSASPNEPGDISINNVTVDGNKLIIWISSGQAATTYSVTVKTGFASGRILQRTILLPVTAMSAVQTTADAIQTSLRDPLTDQNGNPITSV